MSAVEWYYARENKQTGPVSSLELKRLAAAGELRPADLVWREGMTEWSLAGNVRGLFDGEAKPADSGLKIGEPGGAAPAIALAAAAAAQPATAAPPTPRRHLFDVLLDWLRRRFDQQFIDSTARVFRACGSYGLLAAMVLAAVFAVIMTAEMADAGYLLRGAGGILVLAVLQYIASKFSDRLDQLGAAAGGRISSATLPDCLALLGLAAAVSALVSAVVLAMAFSNYPIVLFGMTMFLVLGYLAIVALHPAMLGVSIAAEARGSEEAIGVLTFLAKALLRLVPVAFGAGVICGDMLLAYACGQAFFGEKGLPFAGETAGLARASLWWFGVLPLAAYVLFLLFCLLIDLCGAILSRAAKPDESAKQE